MSEVRPPLTLFYVYARKDEPLRNELDRYLSSLSRERLISSSWHDHHILARKSWKQEINAHLERASIILLLVSPDFMATSYIYDVEMTKALQLHESGKAYTIPILLRPCVWERTALGKLQCLPRNGKPVGQWTNREEAFAEIATDIRNISNELLGLSTSWEPQEHINSIEESSQAGRVQTYPLYEVFVKSGTPTSTFVEPQDFEALQYSLAQPGRGIVIEGPSGVGKTTAVEKAIERLTTKHSFLPENHSIQILNSRDPDHRRRLQILRQWHMGTVIVDDFHRLDAELRRDLVDYLKYLADTSSKSQKLVIVGIPRSGQTLVDASFDVSTRIDVFRFGHVPDDIIVQMIEKGEEVLNISFDRKVEITLASNGSLNVAQFLCFNLCQIARVNETCDQRQRVRCDLDTARSLVIKDLSRKFGESIRRFASMGGPRDYTSMSLLEELVNSEDGFLSLAHLRSKKPDMTQCLEQFVAERWMKQLYHECPDCEQHFFFDHDRQILVIDDPQLAFYLRQLRFSTLAKDAGKIARLTQRKIFISYSHKDARWLERLRVHLKPIEREGIIDLWDDTKIAAGIQWKGAILEALETSRVAVLLISADFLASDFIAEHELPTLLAQVASGGTIVLPVIISPCLFEGTALSAFQAVNSVQKPLSDLPLSERERILVDVARAVMHHLTGAGTKHDGF